MKLLVLFMLACSDSKTDSAEAAEDSSAVDSAENTDSATPQTVRCAQIPLDECASYEQCELVVGSPVVENEMGEYCIDNDTQEAQACADYGCSADPSITIAHPPDSEECWMFPSGCLPEGWSYCTQNPSSCD